MPDFGIISGGEGVSKGGVVGSRQASSCDLIPMKLAPLRMFLPAYQRGPLNWENPSATATGICGFCPRFFFLCFVSSLFRQLKKGANEATKTLNRGVSELVIVCGLLEEPT